jgi:hypothetical protein
MTAGQLVGAVVAWLVQRALVEVGASQASVRIVEALYSKRAATFWTPRSRRL